MDVNNDSMQYSKSLTKEARKREMRKITAENQEILRRIQNAEPTYDHMSWQEDARRHEGYMKNMCELPISIGPLSVAREAEDTMQRTGAGQHGQLQYEN
jgi:E3 ubiquitin-protein ligase TRIP12